MSKVWTGYATIGRVDLLQLVAELDELLDADGTADYCPNGLQVEGKPDVRRIVTGVSASLETFRRRGRTRSRCGGCPPRHPLERFRVDAELWGRSVTASGLLIENRISLIAYHLPLDRHLELGNAAQLARRIGLEELEPFGIHCGASTGVCGVFPNPVEVNEFIGAIAEACEREPQIFPGGEPFVTSVGIVTGGAQKEFHQAVAAGLDAYVTGEASEWVMHQAAEDRVHYVAAGHYATERFGIRALGRWIADRHDLDVEFIDIPNPV